MTEWLVLSIVGLILLSQSTYLFLHARKHGHLYWFWGIVGLIQAPIPLIVYFLLIRKVYRNWNMSLLKQVFLLLFKFSHFLFLFSLLLSWYSVISWKITIVFLIIHGIFLLGLLICLILERIKEKEEDDRNDYRNY